VTTLREESSFDPELFAVPEGYTETSIMDQIPEGVELPEGFSFGGSAEGSAGGSAAPQSDGAEEEAQEEEEGGAFRRFRGLIGR
jgi:hypothetical protein